MWQLLGFGEVGTSGRRYAIADPHGQVHWAGDNMTEAMVFIWQHGLANRMERDASGICFIRESRRPFDPGASDQHAPPGHSAPR